MTSREDRQQEQAERRRESSPEYILATGEAAASRLEMLEEIFGPHSRQLLVKAGLSKGLRVADIGCGTGLVSLWIGTQVGPEGRVVGVDKSCEQLRITTMAASLASRQPEHISDWWSSATK